MKKDFCYDLNAIDSETKFVLAHKFTDERNKNNCVEFLSEIKENCYQQILERYFSEKHKRIEERFLIEFVCDGFENYRNAFNKLFYRVAKLHFGVPIACKKFGLKHNNNPIERYNGKIKNRLKTMRGEFRSFSHAEAFMNLQRIIHNFVNPHLQLKEKTPAEIAEINLNLRRNKLLKLIRLKPDGVARHLVGKILARLEDTGLKIVGMKMVWVDEEFAR
ncbi:MAG: nucleoside-diphosphate kinase, partial [Nanoarchaeota archaeon]